MIKSYKIFIFEKEKKIDSVLIIFTLKINTYLIFCNNHNKIMC